MTLNTSYGSQWLVQSIRPDYFSVFETHAADMFSASGARQGGPSSHPRIYELLPKQKSHRHTNVPAKGDLIDLINFNERDPDYVWCNWREHNITANHHYTNYAN
jgi:hypothetical protein